MDGPTAVAPTVVAALPPRYLDVSPSNTVGSIGAADTRLWTHVTALRPLAKAHATGPLLAWLGIVVLTLAWLVRRAQA